jgi:hypothetical protein
MSEDWTLNGHFVVEEPKKIRMAMTVSARLDAWIELEKHLNKIAMTETHVCGLVYELRRQISQMVGAAHASFMPGGKP